MNGRVFFAGVAVGVGLTLVGARIALQPAAVAKSAPARGAASACACPGDFDGNGVINTADLVEFLGAFATTCPPDTDGDGFADPNDNCPFMYNPCQEDFDGDGVGDACDNCPTIPNPGQQDSNNANGCEVQHGLSANNCASATNLGNVCADTRCGAFCASTASAILGPVFNERRTRWFKVRATECSTGCNVGGMEQSIQVFVPAGVNYDVFVYSSCGGTLIGQSTNGAGTAETILISVPKTTNDDSFDYWVEVRWISGQSCTNYTVQTLGRSC